MINYANEPVNFHGCPGCAYAKHEFQLPCGMAYEDELFTLSQDWELPIIGFFVVSPKRCVEKFADLTDEERNKIFELVHKTIQILRNNNICDRFNIVFEEKVNRHFHIWIMPRHKWMEDIFKDPIDNIGAIFNYAKDNYRTEETFNKIIESTNILKEKLKKECEI